MALPFFKTALETNSNLTQYWLSYIDALIKLEWIDAAKAVFDQAKSKGVKGDRFDALEQQLAKRGKDQEAPQKQLESLSDLYIRGQYQEALSKGSQLIEKFPKSVTLYNIIGVINQSLGKLEEAIRAYNKALAMKPDYSEAYNNMGNTLKEQGKLEEAIEAYNKALAMKQLR